MTDPIVPVSWGALLDKIAILEIKRMRLRAPQAVANAERELAALSPSLASLQPAPRTRDAVLRTRGRPIRAIASGRAAYQRTQDDAGFVDEGTGIRLSRAAHAPARGDRVRAAQ